MTSSSHDGIACGADCSEAYASGTVITLTVAPDPGVAFAGWSGEGCGGTGTCQVTLTAATTVTATFNGPSLTVTKKDVGSGTVTSSPPGINCGATARVPSRPVLS